MDVEEKKEEEDVRDKGGCRGGAKVWRRRSSKSVGTCCHCTQMEMSLIPWDHYVFMIYVPREHPLRSVLPLFRILFTILSPSVLCSYYNYPSYIPLKNRI